MKHGTRILFVQPEDPGGGTLIRRLWQPLDLANCAGLLEGKGFHVRIIDNRIERMGKSELARAAKDVDKIFVTSAAFDRWQCPPLDIRPFFEIVSCLDKGRVHIMGPHVTQRPETFLKKTGVRSAILGEPEQAVVALARGDVAVPGTARMDNGECVYEKETGRAAFSRAWPAPAFHRLPMGRYHYALMDRPFTLLEGSRGCPFHCRFCYKGMHPRTFVRKDPEALADEVARVNRKWGIKGVYFMDLEFGLNRDVLERFCRALIRKKTGVSWCCQTRVTDVDDGLLALMAASGCSLIHFGAETGSRRVLDWTGKQIRRSDCVRAVSKARRAKIRSAVFFNLGFPGETSGDMDDTLSWAMNLNPDYASFNMLMPIPGTRLQKEVGVDPESLPCHLYPSHLPEQDTRVLKKKIRKAYLRFYLRPGFMIKAFQYNGLLRWGTMNYVYQSMMRSR